MSTAAEIRPTVLLIGRGEPLHAALRVALDRHGLIVEEPSAEPARPEAPAPDRAGARLLEAVKATAPDLIVLLGDAASEGGRATLELLAGDAVTGSVPVAVLGSPEAVDARVRAFRHGAVAVIPRVASADAIATRISDVVRELSRSRRPDELGEATLDDLVSLVGRELRNGILSVGQKRVPEGQPLRIVLGAGRPVAAAVEEFVRKLAPLVSRAEPLAYELHQGPGGAVALLDGEGESRVDVRIFEGLRVLVVDGDAPRADALAQALRARKAIVVVADAGGAGIERARALDPDVVLVDTQGIEGPGFEVIRRIRHDHRLRWASLLVVPWAELWPSPEGAPDIGRLAEQIEPLVVPDRVLRERAEKEPAFETRLEATGPSRLLRALSALSGPFHVSVRSSRALLELDVAEGLLVGATGTTARGERLEGVRALAGLLALETGRARVEQRSHAVTANLMVPVEQALTLADREESPVPRSVPPATGPASGASSDSAELEPFRRSDRSGPYRTLGTQTLAEPQAGRVAARDLRWTDTNDTKDEPTAVREVPSIPPVLARTSLPMGIASAVKDSIVAPVPRPALEAPMSAFSASSPTSPPRSALAAAELRGIDSAETARPGELKRPGERELGIPAAKELRAAPVARVPLAATPVAGRKPSQQRTLTFGAVAAPKPTLEANAARARSAEELPARTPAAPAALFSEDATAIEMARTTRDLGPPAALFRDPDLPAAAPKPAPEAPPPVPEAAIHDVLATLGRLGPTRDASRPEASSDIADPEIPFAPFSVPPEPVGPGALAGPASAGPSPAAGPSVSPLEGRPSGPRRSVVRLGGYAAVAAAALSLAAVGALLGTRHVGLLGEPPAAAPPPSDPAVPSEAPEPPTPEPPTLEPPTLEAPPTPEPRPPEAPPTPEAPEPRTSEAPAPPTPEVLEPAPEPPTSAVTVEGAGGADAPALIRQAAEARDDATRERLYRQALALDPREHHAMVGLAEIHLRRHEPALAIPLLEAAVRRRRGRAEFRVLLGDARRDSGDTAGAATAWREALELDPDNRQAHERLGQ
ncbi:MAG: tetratricopeptide repeat protein [Deltaproteobacteria bacterium]